MSQRSTSFEGGKKGAEMGEAANLRDAVMGFRYVFTSFKSNFIEL